MNLLSISEPSIDEVVSLCVEFSSDAESEFFHFELNVSLSFICLFDPTFEFNGGRIRGRVGPDAEAGIEFAIVGERQCGEFVL